VTGKQLLKTPSTKDKDENINVIISTYHQHCKSPSVLKNNNDTPKERDGKRLGAPKRKAYNHP